uniref:Transmembrane and immunoglobulin domain containing 1 n=1 Tax=Strigops habroptila TaxID=2489341 RepID=A0A672USF3_STRHB
MVQRSSLAAPYEVPLLAVCLLVCVATGKQWKKSLLALSKPHHGKQCPGWWVTPADTQHPHSPSSAGLELSVNDQYADFSLTTTPGPLVSLSCLVQNSSEAEELVWYREDGEVDLNDANKVNISNVCISPVTESDNGVTFTCQLARDDTVQVSVTLDVQFPPDLSGEEILYVEEDKDVTLSCNAKSNPQATAVWYKDNSTLTLQEDHHEVYLTSEVFELSIQTVEASDNGTYTCVLSSSIGEGSKDFHLIVEDKKSIFPLEAVIAAGVVVFFTILFAIVARRDKIFKVWKALVS